MSTPALAPIAALKGMFAPQAMIAPFAENLLSAKTCYQFPRSHSFVKLKLMSSRARTGVGRPSTSLG
jgi:hypothetical protein